MLVIEGAELEHQCKYCKHWEPVLSQAGEGICNNETYAPATAPEDGCARWECIREL
jgi:hypothetical protein